MTKPTKWVRNQRRLRSACASAQSDQSLRCADAQADLSLRCVLNGKPFFMRTAKTLIRLGGCPGSFESSLGAHSVCWFCHVAAQLNFLSTHWVDCWFFSRHLNGNLYLKYLVNSCHCKYLLFKWLTPQKSSIWAPLDKRYHLSFSNPAYLHWIFNPNS